MWSCLDVIRQDKMGTHRLVINHSKLWNSLNIWGTTLTDQNSINGEIKSRLN